MPIGCWHDVFHVKHCVAGGFKMELPLLVKMFADGGEFTGWGGRALAKIAEIACELNRGRAGF